MKYVKFSYSNGYCGCDGEEYQEFDDDITDAELSQIAIDLAMDNAESYEHIVYVGIDEEEEDYAEARQEALDDYYENCVQGYYELVSKSG